jgi:hypothetical protein
MSKRAAANKKRAATKSNRVATKNPKKMRARPKRVADASLAEASGGAFFGLVGHGGVVHTNQPKLTGARGAINFLQHGTTYPVTPFNRLTGNQRQPIEPPSPTSPQPSAAPQHPAFPPGFGSGSIGFNPGGTGSGSQGG